ncbi:MAG: aminoglycoside phosphotransferase family protein, partial [Planctomycetes bacterium]|nr:aminoglycoside phosphotransferase family protein [Planctomycetota bacterium]
MTWRWTDSLREPVSTALRELDALRLDRSRKAGWHVLLPSQRGEGIRWVGFDEDFASAPKRLSPLRDHRLDTILPSLGRWLDCGATITLVAYKPGRRVVLFADDGQEPVMVKLYHKDRGYERRWRVATTCPGVATPRVVDWDAKRRCLTTTLIGGASLNQRWLSNRGEPTDGVALAEVVRGLWEVRPPQDFGTFDAYDEIATLEARLPEYHEILATPSPRAETLVAQVSKALANTASDDRVLCHRDFHDKQVLIDGDRVGLIDFDLAALGPRALDVGNMIAHIRLRDCKGARFGWREIAG